MPAIVKDVHPCHRRCQRSRCATFEVGEPSPPIQGHVQDELVEPREWPPQQPVGQVKST